MVKVRRSVWAFVVSLVAALMVPVVAAPAAYAAWEPPSVREIGERLLGTAVPDCRTSTGAAGIRWPDGTCGELSYGYGPTPGNAVRPAVSSALAGAERVVMGFKTVGTGCVANKTVCATLALSSFAALLGIGAGTQEVLELFAEPNPDHAPGGSPVGQALIDEMYSTPGHFKTPCASATPTSIAPSPDNPAWRMTLDMQWECWVLQNYFSAWQTDIGVHIQYQCRVRSTGDLGAVRDQSLGNFYWQQYDHGGTPGNASRQASVDFNYCNPADSDLVYFSMYDNGPTTGGMGSGSDGGPTLFWHSGVVNAAPGEDPVDYREDGSTGGSRLECRDSLGSTYYVDTSAPAGTWDVPAPKCLDGDIPTGLDVGTRAPGGGLTADTTYDLSPESLRPDTSSTGAYPLCAGAACTYAVKVDGKVCGVGDAECVRWTQNPAAQCWYGPYTVDRSACYLLERAFEVQSPSVPATRPNTDGDPETHDGPNPATDPVPQPAPDAKCVSAYYDLGTVTEELVWAVDSTHEAVGSFITNVFGYRPEDPYPDHPSGVAADFMVASDAAGQAVADHLVAMAASYRVEYILWDQHSWNPSRGTWVPMADRGSPTANHKDHVHLSVNTSPGTVECGTGAPQYGEGADAPEESRECFPLGWSAFNPWQWVYMPVMCALSDAFEPNPVTTAARVADVRNELETRGPGPAIGEVGALFDSVPEGAGCQGPPITLTLGGETFTFHLLNACDEPMKTVAGFSHALGTMFVIVGGGLGIVRAVGAAFNLDISMGRGGGSDGV